MQRPFCSLVLLLLPAIAIAQHNIPFEPIEPPRYDLSVRLFPASRQISVAGTLRFRAGGDDLHELKFMLDQRLSDLKLEVLEPHASAGAGQVSADRGGTVTALLPAPIPAGSDVAVRFSYSGSSNWAPRFYVGPESVFFSGEAYRWYPTLEARRRAIGTLRFDVPAGYVVAATGLRKRVSTADAQPLEFRIDTPTTFSFAVGRFQVQESPGKQTVALYELRPRQESRERLNFLREILRALEHEFGRYPHKDFELVEISSAAAGGSGSAYSMEGFVAAGPDNFESFNLALLAHEMGHQWWADSVAPRGPRGRMLLTESMAQYGAMRVVERIAGPKAGESFRRCGYPGYELFQNRVGYLSYALAGYDRPLVNLSGDPYGHVLANSKGFLVYHLLAKTIGEKRLRDVLRGFARKHAFQDVAWDEFLRAIQQHVRSDLSGFFDQWYERDGVPGWTLDWQQKGSLVNVSVEQMNRPYRFAADLVVEGAGQRLFKRVPVANSRTDIQLKVNFPVKSVRLDPNFDIPHWTDGNRAAAQTLLPVVEATGLLQTGRASEALKRVREEAMKEQDSERRFMARVFLFYVADASGRQQETKLRLEEALSSSSRRDDLLPFLYYQRALLAKTEGNRAVMEESVRLAGRAEESLVAPSGWGAAAQRLVK